MLLLEGLGRDWLPWLDFVCTVQLCGVVCCVVCAIGYHRGERGVGWGGGWRVLH